MCTCTRSRRSVSSRCRLCSTPGPDVGRRCSRAGNGGTAPAGGSPSRQPHLEARKTSSRREAEVPADQLLAATVVDRRVDQVDAAVEHRVSSRPASASEMAGPRGDHAAPSPRSRGWSRRCRSARAGVSRSSYPARYRPRSRSTIRADGVRPHTRSTMCSRDSQRKSPHARATDHRLRCQRDPAHLDALRPTFHRIFSDPAALRLWFANLITYSEAPSTLSGVYVPFTDIWRCRCSRCSPATRGITISDSRLVPSASTPTALRHHAAAP